MSFGAVEALLGRYFELLVILNELTLAAYDVDDLSGALMLMVTDRTAGLKAALHHLVRAVIIHLVVEGTLSSLEAGVLLPFNRIVINYHYSKPSFFILS